MTDRSNFGRLSRAVLFSTAILFLSPPIGAQTAEDSAAEVTAQIENYRVGEDVYVRALSVDAGRNSLWVGTSLGVMEIDLDTRDVKNTFTRADGLASEYVFAVGVDPHGPVWFGTNAGGATRYDSDGWKTYFPMHGLADYWVYCFAFDDNDNIWIGTWDGASLFNTKTGAFTTYREELINIWVYGVDIDDVGRVWFGTEGGVSMYDHGRWRSWTHDDGVGAPNTALLPNSPNTGLGTRTRHDLSVTVGGGDSYNANYVFAVLVDRPGRGVWFGTWGGGVSLFDGGDTWTSYTVADGLAGNVVYSIAQAQDGTLWFGTDKGASRFDGETWRTYRHGLLGSHVYAITLTDDGSVWFGTKGGVGRLTAAK